MIEFTADDEIDVAARCQTGVRLQLNVGTDEGDLQIRMNLFHAADQPQVALKSRGRGEEHDEVVVAGDLDRLRHSYFVRRGIEHATVGKHAGRIGEPDGIPVRLDLASRWPARARAAVVALEAGWVQEERLHAPSLKL